MSTLISISVQTPKCPVPRKAIPKLGNTVNTVQIPPPALAVFGQMYIICTVFTVFPNLGMAFLI